VTFSVLFGPSRDYLVFLVSRIQEDWHQLHHAPEADLAALKGHAVRRGQHHDRRLRLVPSWGQRVLAEFGFALGFSVLVDALIIRGLLVPALMHLIGPANWALPTGLERGLPRLPVAERADSLAVVAGAESAPTRLALSLDRPIAIFSP
jgi:putative drug exporter of the RND superfamily